MNYKLRKLMQMKFNWFSIIHKFILAILTSSITISITIKYVASTSNWLSETIRILLAGHLVVAFLILLVLSFILLQLLSKKVICQKLWDKSIEHPKNNEDIYILLLILLTLIGFYLRFFHLNSLSFWADESITANAAISILNNGIPAFTSGMIYTRAILNTVIVALSFEIFGINEFAGRLPSVIFGTLSIPMIYLLGKKLGNRNIGLAVAILTTFSVYAIVWSMQTRMYTQLQFFYIASLYLFYIVFEDKKIEYSPLLLVTFIAALLSHVFAYSLIVIFSAYLFIIKSVPITRILINNKIKLNIAQTIFIIVGGLLCIVILWEIFGNDIIGIISVASNTNIDNYDYYTLFLLNTYSLLYYSAIIGIILATILIIRNHNNTNKILLLILSFVVPFYVISYHVGENFYRYIYFITPIFFIFSMYFLEILFAPVMQHVYKINENKNVLFKNHKNALECTVVVICVLLAIIIPSTAFAITPKDKYSLEPDTPQPDYRAAFTFVKDNIKPNDTLILDLPNTMHALYYMGDKYSTDKTYILYEKKFVGQENGTLFDIYSGASVIENISMFKDVIKFHNSGWVVLEIEGKTKETYDFISQNMQRHLVTSPQVDLSSPLMSPSIKTRSILEVYSWDIVTQPTTSTSVYSDDFDTDKWNIDKDLSHGIDRSVNIIVSNESVIYPIDKNKQAYVKYHLNFSNIINNSTITVTGNRRDAHHNLSVWGSADNKTYSKIIDFKEIKRKTNQADITNYTKDNQTWIEFRFFRSSNGENMPRILDFSITAIPKNNQTIEITPFGKDGSRQSGTILSYNTHNLIQEPSFEHYKDSINPPIAWSFTSDNGAVAHIDNTGFDGNYSYRVSVQNARKGVADMSQIFDLDGNTSYRLNATHKQSGNGNAAILMQWFNYDWKLVGEDKLDLAGKEQWGTSSIEKTIPTDTMHGKVILQYKTTAGDSGIAWFDNINIHVI